MKWMRMTILSGFLAWSTGIPDCPGQVTVATPQRSSAQGFFSNMETSLGFRNVSPHSAMFFRSGAIAPVTFGGLATSNQANFGFSGRHNGLSWKLGFSMAQGSSRQAVSTVANLTIPNGGYGFLNNTIRRPFVVGFVPLVGTAPRSPLHEKLARLRSERLRQTPRTPGSDESPPQNVVSSGRRPARSDDPPLVLRGAARANAE